MRSSRTWLGALGTSIVVLAFALSSPILGLMIGGVIAVGWWFLPSMSAFVIGQFALVALLPTTSDLLILVSAEVGLIGILVESTVKTPRPGRVLLIAICTIGIATTLGWAGYQRFATIVGVTGFLLGGGAVLAYWIHRYERVTLSQPADTPLTSNE